MINKTKAIFYGYIKASNKWASKRECDSARETKKLYMCVSLKKYCCHCDKCVRAWVGIRASVHKQFYSIINIVQWFLSISIHHMRRWILFRRFLLPEYCIYGECVWTRYRKRNVISQLWKSFVWLFFLFFFSNCVYNNNFMMLYLCVFTLNKYERQIHAHKNVCFMLSKPEREREKKNAIHYNRAGSKMLRLMEINGFVRYVLLYVCVSRSLVHCMCVSVSVCVCEYNCWFYFFIFGSIFSVISIYFPFQWWINSHQAHWCTCVRACRWYWVYFDEFLSKIKNLSNVFSLRSCYGRQNIIR